MSKKNILIIGSVVGILIIIGIILLPNLLSDEDKIVEKVQNVLSKKYEIKAEYFSPLNKNGEKEVLKSKDSVIQYKIKNVLDYGNGNGQMCININGDLLCENTEDFEFSGIKFIKSPSEKNTVYALIPYYNIFYSLNNPDPIFFTYEYKNKFYKSNTIGTDLKFESLVNIEFKDNKSTFKEEIGSDIVSINIVPKEVETKSYTISDNFTKELGFLKESTDNNSPSLLSAALVGTNAGDFFIIEKSSGEYTDSIGESSLPFEFNIKRIGQEARGSSKLDIELNNYDVIKFEIKNNLSNLIEIEDVEDNVSYYSPYIVKKVKGSIPNNYFMTCVSNMFDTNVENTCDDLIINNSDENSGLIGVPNNKSGGFYIAIVNDPYIVEKHDVLLMKKDLVRTIMVYDYRDKALKSRNIMLNLSDGPKTFRVKRGSKDDSLITYELNDDGKLVQGMDIENKIYQIISSQNDIFKIENNSCALKGKYNECVFTITPLAEGEFAFKITGAGDKEEVYRVHIN